MMCKRLSLRILSLGVLIQCCLLCNGEAVHLYSSCRECLKFPSNGTLVTHIEGILIDERNDRLIVGAKNLLLRLELTTLQLPSVQNDEVALPPSQEAVAACLSLGQAKINCQNYIKLLLFDQQGHIFVCGTYAATPKCWKFKRNDSLSPPPQGINGDGISPSSYQRKVTGIFTRGHLFTGISNRRSVISKIEADLSRSAFLTSDSSLKVLKDADFVTSFHHMDNFVYFFLRETAVEMSKVVYSRVARVCQYDEGGDGHLNNKFTSFVKTRILCSVPGKIPFNYNEIHAAVTYTDPVTNEVYVYGIFTTLELGVLGSAVCTYSMKSVQELFDHSPYLKDTGTKGFDGISLWVPEFPVNLTVVPGRPKCDTQLDTKNYSWKTTKFASDHTLLADPLVPRLLFKARKPLFTRAETRFTQLVVDKVNIENRHVVPVMFISTDNGTVFKVFNNISGDGNPIIVEQIQVFENPDPIFTMKLYKGAVYIGSDSSVTKLPVEHCSEYQSCRTCISRMDPYCGWSNKCTTFDNKKGSGWAQDIVHGNVSKVCPQEPPACSVTSALDKMGLVNSLICRGDGIPLPRVTRWEKDSKPLPVHADFQIKPGKTSHQERLNIHNFGLEHLGVYNCFVSNEVGSSSCVINVAGALPVTTYALVKISGASLFVCNATGLPIPHITIYKVTGNTKHVVLAHQTTITDDAGQRSYYCVAQNYFGVSFSKQIDINDKPVKAELKFTNEEWSSELYDKNSDRYKSLADQVETAVQGIYFKNPAFVNVEDISFREGSVLCKMTINFAAEASSKNGDLLKDLQARVSSGKVGNLNVDAGHILDVEPDVEPTPAPDKQDSTDEGLFAVAVMTAVLLSFILGFMLGVKFHAQVINRCTPASGDSESCDGPKNRPIEGVKYTKSPPRDENFKRNKNETQSKRNLLKKKGRNTEQTEDSDSDSSTAGKIAQEEKGNEKNSSTSSSPTKSISPSVSVGKVANKKPSLENGKSV